MAHLLFFPDFFGRFEKYLYLCYAYDYTYII